MHQGYFVLLPRNLCSGSHSVKLVLENPALKTLTPKLSSGHP